MVRSESYGQGRGDEHSGGCYVGKRLTRVLTAGIALALGIAAIGIADERPYVTTCLLSTTPEASDCPPRLIANFGAKVVPRKLPTRALAPVAVELWGKVATADGSHPPALREATVNFDRNLVIDAKGLPVCRARELGTIERSCRGSLIGGGEAVFGLAFPETTPIRDPSKLTVYNGGVKGGVTLLHVVAPIDIPTPRMIVTRVEIERIDEGPYGLRAVAKIPVLAGGNGSLLDFRLRIKRLFNHGDSQKSYAMARCPNRYLKAALSALFRNETHETGVASTTQIKGSLLYPCEPTS